VRALRVLCSLLQGLLHKGGLGGHSLVRIGLDVGKVRIGVAVCDELGLVASPHTVIRSKGWGNDIARVVELVSEVGAGEIVVGLPVNMNGTRGPAAARVEEFCHRLSESVSVPVVTWDERLSTAQASRVLIEADLSRKRRRDVIDKTAAAIILQAYLDNLASRR